MRTPFPWFQSQSQPKQVVAGGADRRPVARFNQADDARSMVRILDGRDEILATLRENLVILQDELKNRQFSGVPDYIEPVRLAVERTKKAIARAEGWT